jgi:hypothetical protein
LRSHWKCGSRHGIDVNKRISSSVHHSSNAARGWDATKHKIPCARPQVDGDVGYCLGPVSSPSAGQSVILTVLRALLAVAHTAEPSGVSKSIWRCVCLTILQGSHVLRLQRAAPSRGPRQPSAAQNETLIVHVNMYSRNLDLLAMTTKASRFVFARCIRVSQWDSTRLGVRVNIETCNRIVACIRDGMGALLQDISQRRRAI